MEPQMMHCLNTDLTVFRHEMICIRRHNSESQTCMKKTDVLRTNNHSGKRMPPMQYDWMKVRIGLRPPTRRIPKLS